MGTRVAVIGAGISGAACAATLRRAGIDVAVFERGRTEGGRMASPTIGQRRVDLGASYFTASDDEFLAQVRSWRDDGLARPWTDTFDVISPDGRSTTTGPMRWAADDGLRSLVRALDPQAKAGNQITDLRDLDQDAVVLAMPDPQAARLAPDAFDWVDYEPVITVAAAWDTRAWDLDTAAFVNGDPDVTMIADDGSRRGDDAPVLVAHSTGELATRHLSAPDDAIAPVVATLRRLLDIGREPVVTYAHRWTFAKPTTTHGDEPFGLATSTGRLLGVCGDSWCPSGPPRTEAAWLSGHRLGAALADELG
ncbi:NAD(P)/FAD-dependent oxidoreductase [Jatrophihabitans endophyticus]|uniref:NAD(P)/FAD-dependent oxidoreductase n=1 Tax=Jatrophihabitans endophyticus TaxID=1206085 RepID=UPI0026F2295B|nr:FAD-dependent oxidoreductase [Jatrophihabitans endophyticus]